MLLAEQICVWQEALPPKLNSWRYNTKVRGIIPRLVVCLSLFCFLFILLLTRNYLTTDISAVTPASKRINNWTEYYTWIITSFSLHKSHNVLCHVYLLFHVGVPNVGDSRIITLAIRINLSNSTDLSPCWDADSLSRPRNPTHTVQPDVTNTPFNIILLSTPKSSK
jgi:hypothetical protein